MKALLAHIRKIMLFSAAWLGNLMRYTIVGRDDFESKSSATWVCVVTEISSSMKDHVPPCDGSSHRKV